MQTLLESVTALCREAGGLILDIYQQTDKALDVHYKADASPLTQADLQANACLVEGLARLRPGVPILSEESELPALKIREQWSEFWLVDPLDGTKEFIHRTGDFTVNVALIREGRPVLGVVYAPLSGVLYTGINEQGRVDGAFKVNGGERKRLQISKALYNHQALRVVTSRRHGLEALESMLRLLRKKAQVADEIAVGSSLKLCLVAEGVADLYPRFGPTSQWDTAAAQAIVEAAGGHVVNRQWQRLVYHQKHSVLNPEFYVLGDSIARWRPLLDGSV